jgi:hypothetical protein
VSRMGGASHRLAHAGLARLAGAGARAIAAVSVR